MAAIGFFEYHILRIAVRHIICVTLLLFSSNVIISQVTPVQRPGRRMIELINADIDSIVIDKHTGKDIHHFLGNVLLRHNEITMSCDSAHFSQDKNQVTAYSKIHIEQGDTLDLFGDYLFYDGKSEIALVTGNVELIDKETHLFTKAI